MKSPFIKILLFFCFIVLFQDCRKHEENCFNANPPVYYINLNASSLTKTRYFTDPHFDTVSFKVSNGDTLIFVKTSCDSSTYDIVYNGGAPGCGPDKIEKYLEITNRYTTLKGEGSFMVKHSRRTRTDYNNSPDDHVIEIWFMSNHFYFFERFFGRKEEGYYVGDYTIGNKQFIDVCYSWSLFKKTSGVKAYFAPNFGIIQVTDSINATQYETLN